MYTELSTIPFEIAFHVTAADFAVTHANGSKTGYSITYQSTGDITCKHQTTLFSLIRVE
jgi:hypothetical protein